MSTRGEHERIVRLDTCTVEELETHLMEQVAARLVLCDLEHGGTGRELTWEEMGAVYDAVRVQTARLLGDARR